MFHTIREKILSEIMGVLKGVKEEEVDSLIELILSSKRIVTCGAGRMGMMAKAFAMRLSHLNRQAYHIGDCNIPRVGEGDLLLVSSGSGETRTILALAEVAKQHKAKIALITSRPFSSIAALADAKVVLPAPSKLESLNSSIQPMTSLTEQSCLMFFDTLVLMIMHRLNETDEMLKTRHSILE